MPDAAPVTTATPFAKNVMVHYAQPLKMTLRTWPLSTKPIPRECRRENQPDQNSDASIDCTPGAVCKDQLDGSGQTASENRYVELSSRL
jgi:hypothetical protein